MIHCDTDNFLKWLLVLHTTEEPHLITIALCLLISLLVIIATFSVGFASTTTWTIRTSLLVARLLGLSILVTTLFSLRCVVRTPWSVESTVVSLRTTTLWPLVAILVYLFSIRLFFAISVLLVAWWTAVGTPWWSPVVAPPVWPAAWWATSIVLASSSLGTLASLTTALITTLSSLSSLSTFQTSLLFVWAAILHNFFSPIRAVLYLATC